jgi:hypothetical protein
MRKIEQLMNAAIKAGEDFKLANTMVINEGGISFVFLHGNKIAEVGDRFIRLFDGGFQSNTTKSRLNAILGDHGVPGEHIFQKNFTWFVRTVQGVKPTDGEGFISIPFFSGMRLN